jgi:hypothetical protein
MYSRQERLANERKFNGLGEMSEMQENLRRALNHEGGLFQQGERESIQRAIDVLQERIDANLNARRQTGRVSREGLDPKIKLSTGFTSKPEKWSGYEDDAYEPGFRRPARKGEKGGSDGMVEDQSMTLDRWAAEAPVGSTLRMSRENGTTLYEMTPSGLKQKMVKSWGDLHKHAQHEQASHGNWSRGGGRVTASGAYGRDYKSKKAVMEDWNAYKDFTMRGMRSGYINRQDADEGGVEVEIRYDKDRKVMFIKPQKPQSAEERTKAIDGDKKKSDAPKISPHTGRPMTAREKREYGW